MSSGGSLSCNWRNQSKEALLKNEVEVAALTAQAVAWCVFWNANSALLSSDLMPSTMLLEMTEDEDSAVSGGSTEGRASKSSC